jgi:virginiamycin B lyase
VKLVVCTLSVLALACCGVAVAATPAITEFPPVPTGSPSLQGIAMGPDGNMWFTEFGANKIGRITPAGVVTEFAIPGPGDPKPFAIAAGHDGAMWFTEFNRNSIGRITTAGVFLASVPLTAGANPVGIAADNRGRIWAAESGIDKIARVTPPSTLAENGGGITAGATPRQIVSGPDSAMWFTESAGGKLGRHDLGSTGSVERGATSGDAIAAAPDDSLWFVNPGTNQITTQLLTGSGGLVLGSMPTAASFPAGIAAGPDGNMWITEVNGNKIARFEVEGHDREEFGTGITAGSGPFGIAAGPDGAMWFTESTGRIGRITTGEDPPAFTAPGRLGFDTGAGGASSYPATIQVSGLTGVVTRVRVRLNGLFAQDPRDFGALLVDPGGRAVLLFSGAGSGSDAEGAVMTFADDGLTLDGFTSGRFVPGKQGLLGGAFPAPAPAGPYSASLSDLNGADPNGDWKLFLARTSPSFPAAIDALVGGWSLDIKTAPPQTIAVPGPTQTVTVTTPGPTVTVPAPPDTRRASVKLSKISSSTTLAKLLKGISLTLTPDEPVSLSVSLIGTQKKATLAAVRVALFEKAFGLSSGPRAVKLKPSKSALGSPRKAFKLTLRVVATDRGGNQTRVDRPLRVTVPKKKRR